MGKEVFQRYRRARSARTGCFAHQFAVVVKGQLNTDRLLRRPRGHGELAQRTERAKRLAAKSKRRHRLEIGKVPQLGCVVLESCDKRA